MILICLTKIANRGKKDSPVTLFWLQVYFLKLYLERQVIALVQVHVRDNNVDQALRILKRKMQKEGLYREMKQRRFYEKPSEKRVREQQEAVRRARKLARKRNENA